MEINDGSLPTDLETCQRELLRVNAELGHVKGVYAETAALCEQQQGELEKLKAELELLKRCVFGRRSERRVDSSKQGRLFEEPAEGEPSRSTLPQEACEEEITYRRRRRGHGWGKIPEHFPREEKRLDIPEEEKTCACGERKVEIGEERVERVDYVPARVTVTVFILPKYACPKGDCGVTQAATPPSPVPGGRYGFGLMAQTLTSKFADHLTLYRDQDIFARAGLELARSTLCEMVANGAFLLEPLAAYLRDRLMVERVLGVDDTPVRLLDPEHPLGVRLARFWLYRGLELAPYNVFGFHPSRERKGPAEFLKDFRGTVKVDAYGVEGGVYLNSDGRILASCCMAHARRKFVEATSSHPVAAAEALAFFHRLYDIEDRALRLSAEERRALREREAVPVLAQMRTWLDMQAKTMLPKLKFREAVGYMLNQWEELTNYVHDGRLPIDNNATERDLRQLTIGRKNWLFIGSPEAGPRAATIYTVVASAVRHDLDVWAYLRDALERLAVGGTDLAELLPDVWARGHPESIRRYRGHEREARAAAVRARRARRRILEKAGLSE
jgi:transposase